MHVMVRSLFESRIIERAPVDLVWSALEMPCTLQELGVCVSCNPSPGGCYIRSNGKVQHRPAGCPCAGRPGGNHRLAFVVNDATSNVVDTTACGGTRNTSKYEPQIENAFSMDSGSSSSSGEEAEEPKTQQLGFGKDPRFRNHGALLPEALEKAASVLADKYEFTDLTLWRSFLWFFGFLASLQPAALIDLDMKTQFQKKYSNVGQHEMSLFDCKYVDKNLDMAFRSRSKQAGVLWRDLYGSLPVTAQRLGVWALLDAIFRYPGDVRCVRGCLAACPHEDVVYLFSEGLTQDNLQPVTDMLKRGFQLDWSMRSTVSAYFSKGDGRKLVYSSPKPAISPDDKRCDHMHAALTSWAQAAGKVAECMMFLKAALEAADADVERAEPEAIRCALELMHAILQYDLLGRPGVKMDRPVPERAGCYAAKFVLDDCYWLIMCATCLNVKRSCDGEVTHARARCPCLRCKLLLKVRQQCMFIGPAFRNLLMSLRGEGCSNKAKLEREAMDIGVRLLADLNDVCRSSFDLYALQFAPCIWGKFTRGLARLLNAEPRN